MGRAVFWPARDFSTTGKRVLEGEVNLKKALKQTVIFPRFAVRVGDFIPCWRSSIVDASQYHLEVHAFEVAGFMHAPPVSGPLMTQPVSVTSFHAAGVVMHSFAPPEYVQEENENFNNSVGLLENGNQRFYHHAGSGIA